MKKQTKKWVKFYRPGSFYAEDWNVECNSHPSPENIEWPEYAYCAEMVEREDVIDGEKQYHGDMKKIGPTYYHPDSKVESLEEVKMNPQATEILITNMEANEWDLIVWSRWGNFPQPYDPEKHSIPSKG